MEETTNPESEHARAAMRAMLERQTRDGILTLHFQHGVENKLGRWFALGAICFVVTGVLYAQLPAIPLLAWTGIVAAAVTALFLLSTGSVACTQIDFAKRRVRQISSRGGRTRNDRPLEHYQILRSSMAEEGAALVVYLCGRNGSLEIAQLGPGHVCRTRYGGFDSPEAAEIRAYIAERTGLRDIGMT